jgi:hypothetical protein
MRYSCKYYSVGFFVFADFPDARMGEPLIEVEDEQKGEDLIAWLSRMPFVAYQMRFVANDNPSPLIAANYPAPY